LLYGLFTLDTNTSHLNSPTVIHKYLPN
jgi:hypothetical protein